MNPTEALTLVVSAVVVPVIVKVVTNPTTSGNRKRALVVGTSTALGVVSLIITGQITVIPLGVQEVITRLVVYAALITVASQGVYQLFRSQLSTEPAPKRALDGPADDTLQSEPEQRKEAA